MSLRRRAPRVRGVAIVAALLAACAPVEGTPVESCGVDWFDVERVIATAAPGQAGDAETVPIQCIRTIGARRLRVGFELPPGPDCHELVAVATLESADAVAVTLFVDRVDDPLAGPCAPRSVARTTELDLAAPIAERTLLDGSR